MATEEDTWATNIKKELQERPRNPNRDDLDQFEQQDGLLLRNNLIYVPKGPIRLKILRECHDNTLAGHFGIARTHELVSRIYWWHKMNKLLQEYVKSCDTCARSKAPRHRSYSLDSYSLCRFLADLGDLLQWTSSRTSLLLEPRIQYWLWSIHSPKWPISPLVPSQSR
jgi:hypothetical protein